MATFQWINENEIESGYFWEVPASNPLVALWVLEETAPEPTGISKVIARQKTEEEDTWISTKIAETFTGGIERIQEAWEWLATGKFDIPEAFARGAAWSLQSFFSPIAWVLQEWVEESIQAMSDDFKQNVMETTAPTIQSVVKWYQWQTPDQQRHLDNVGVWLEVLLELVWGSAVKKPLQEIAWEAIEATKEAGKTGVWLAKEGIEKVTEKVSDIELPWTTKAIDELPAEMRTEKGLINWIEVEVPVVDRWVTEKLTKTFTKNITDKTLAWKAVSPRTVWKNVKQKLSSIANVEKNTKKFYENVRTWVLEWDIWTLEDAAQTIVNNIDIVWARIGDAVKKVEGNIDFDNKITDDIINALNTKGAEVSPATPVLNKFFESLGNGKLTIDEAYELKKAYQNEVTKLFKSWDAGTAQYKALSDWVKFLNQQIDNIIETRLGWEFAKDKELFRSLKLLVDDMVASSLVEGRRSANTLAERIGLVESLFSPVASAKQKLIQSVDDLNTRGWAWTELIKRYDEAAIKNAQSK